MKTAKMLTILVVALGLMVCSVKLGGQTPMGTAITYQGRLIDANAPADGLYDFEFKLYDDPNAGTQQGRKIDMNDLDLIDGYFMVELDFGSGVFIGDTRWLETGVRTGDSNEPNDFVTLSPRQEITAVPYALQTRGIYVDPNGNVGIGTTSPAEKLDVNGDIKVRNISLVDSDITDKGSLRIIIDRDNDQTDQTFSVWRDGTVSPPGAELFRIQENGNVGIGTTNPIYPLEVSGGLSSSAIYATTNSGGGAVAGINTGIGAGVYGRSTSNYGVMGIGGGLGSVGGFFAAPSGHALITWDGNVGIGTTSPSAKLEVAGQVKITGGSPEAGKVLTSDANGLASWQAPSTGALPRGVIVMWSGSVATIPTGWALCDGTNGTPDLRDRFIVGARQDDGGVAKTNVKGSLMQTGGGHEHTLIEAEMPAHRHTGRFSDQREDSSGDDTQYDVNKGATSFSGTTGGNQAHENCPPFYALVFIMHL